MLLKAGTTTAAAAAEKIKYSVSFCVRFRVFLCLCLRK